MSSGAMEAKRCSATPEVAPVRSASTRAGRLSRVAWLALVLSLLGPACTGFSNESDASDRVAAPDPNPLFTAPADHDFTKNPELLGRIAGSPHGYFRFVNLPFARAVCGLFAADMYLFPDVNLHGDAHIEQYAITPSGRGLTDFDAASVGPGVIDLVRFCTSLRLACRLRGWQDVEDRMCDTFLRGYLTAVQQPEFEAAEPRLVARTRATFADDPNILLNQAQEMMTPLEVPMDYLRERLADYSRVVLAEDPKLPAGFFTIKTAGNLKAGIGSALDIKHLIRVEGPSPSADDDVMLEVKEVKNLTGVDCIRTARLNDPIRILTGGSRLAYQPYRYAGYIIVPPDEQSSEPRSFLIWAWGLAYQEVSIIESLTDSSDLLELAHDVGVQLGRGHPRDIAAPHEKKLRIEQSECVKRFRGRIMEASRELTELTVQAWERFCVEAGGIGPVGEVD